MKDETPTRSPYIPRGIPVLGVLHRVFRDPLPTLVQLSREHPGLVRLREGWFFVSAPEHIHRVLAGPYPYVKGGSTEDIPRLMRGVSQEALGGGLLTSDGELW